MSIQDYYSNIINVEPFIGEGLKKFNYSLRWLNFPSMGHKIGRIYRNPDYKYEIIIPDNSSPSPSSRGRSSQPTKRDYLTKSNRNELLFLSIHPSLLFQRTWFLTDFLSRSFNLVARPPIPLPRSTGWDQHFSTLESPSPPFFFSFNSNRIPVHFHCI